jgi:exopolysaccharide biosynthesis polyprenyl glycosylphosphotransferase
VLGGKVTDLISRPESSVGSTLYRERFLSVVESGQATWPSIERRRGPRRRLDAQDRLDRRVTEAPAAPMLVPAQATGPARRDRHVAAYRKTVFAIDISVAALAAVAAQLERFGTTAAGRSTMYWWGVLLLPALWVMAVGASRAYESRFLASSAEEYRRVINAAAGLTAVVAVISYLSKAQFARGYVIVALPTCTLFAVLGRYFARHSLRRARARGRFLQEVVVVGHEWPILDLVAELRRNPDSGLRVIGACVPGGRGSRQMAEAGVPVVGDIHQVVQAVTRLHADVLAVTTCVEFGGPELRKVCWALENTDVDVVVAPALIEVAGPRLHIRPVARLPLLHVEKPEFTGGRRIVKGTVDRIVAVAALSLLSPILLAIAIAIRLNSAGPALFRQTRIGVRGVPFTIYKFRSMNGDAEAKKSELTLLNDNADGLLFKMRSDPRVTAVGRFLRRYSLDELPQLINVAKGEMSLVGPRPPLPSEVEQYADDVRRRLLVKPGVTGLWQVSGRSDLSWDDSVRLDLRYVENWSLVWDFEILWKTVYAVFRGSGAY